jgi:poly-gamma-glutamate capsule biosynthesis protein CapA/YwtB (metallophosphatase superfamily)
MPDPAPRPRFSRRSFLASMGALLAGGVAAAVGRVIATRHPATPSRASPLPSGRSATPTPSLSASPSSSPSPANPVEGTLVIHGAGDTSLDPTYISTFRTHGYDYAWSGLNGLFLRDDLAVVNVECAVSNLGSKWPGKEFNFRGDPAGLPAMREAGVEVANMANNHSYDYGPTALVDMRKNILKAGMAAVGAGKDPTEANKPAFFDRKGRRVAVLGLDQVVDPYPTAVAAPGHPGTADGHDFEAMLDAVKAAKRDADVLVVMIHWGVELDTVPRSYQVVDGHRLIDAGADVIFGGHSHRLQPLEVYKHRPIFYSLGNFVWPNLSVAGSTTAVAEVTVSPKGTFAARMIPAFIDAPGHPVLRGQ